ncbi:type IV toxin-antitoxin system AbiEi family antitoxin domain-containing protein [Hyphococcus sp.]|uniref:type IV toxin-antitoxin system AbiEi family antitoxin domain-containing protein n=1 Tax=Hyphococcus sp. TaxID=2038636 RepID=UPI003CCB906C
MSGLISQITSAGYADRILNDQQIGRILGGSDDRRYGQVKRALQSRALIRIKRSLYVLAEQYREHPLHPFALAQALVTGSYVSMETALAFHGWIPEAVYTTVSVTPGRKSQVIDHPNLGRFEFNPLALHKSGFLAGVQRHVISDQAMLVASPLRALMDLVAFRKQEWEGIAWLDTGMRISKAHLLHTRLKDFSALKGVYKHKVVNEFLSRLEQEVRALKKAMRTSGKEHSHE